MHESMHAHLMLLHSIIALFDHQSIIYSFIPTLNDNCWPLFNTLIVCHEYKIFAKNYCHSATATADVYSVCVCPIEPFLFLVFLICLLPTFMALSCGLCIWPEGAGKQYWILISANQGACTTYTHAHMCLCGTIYFCIRPFVVAHTRG